MLCHSKSMNILLLGGTGFLGRTITRKATEHGHVLTCLARGNGPVDPTASLVQADRDHDDALSVVAHHAWDAIIDLTSEPGHARKAIRDLRAQAWLYVSSSSVYARNDVPARDESFETLLPLDNDHMADMSEYGAAKVACEEIYRGHSVAHTIIRPGLIGGHGDFTGRSGYYPWRFAHPTGDDVIVPDETFPVALIDVEDLGAWIIHCVEQQHYGTFNATGQTTTLSEVFELARAITDSPAQARTVCDEKLTQAGITPWMGPKSLPLWINHPDWRYIAPLDTTAARNHGLHTRPLKETLVAALMYEESRAHPRLAGLTDQEERDLREQL
ncbi:MAG: NAD-dependent epimerase/dehydratase family protein [Yaniella sp.]|nr:NAD-dependent epimerase/dehydratase family protein [Yaniella sp.]